MRLYQEADLAGNPRGWDSDDQFIARTLSQITDGVNNFDQNVGLFDFNVPDGHLDNPLANQFAGEYYLSIYNPSTRDTIFGLAVLIPEPTSIAALFGIAALMRRRYRSHLPH
jgi:hypothetical protein